MTRIGTSHFVNFNAALRYYEPQDDAITVREKLDSGEIHIGKPALKPGERLEIIDGGTRYAIVTAD